MNRAKALEDKAFGQILRKSRVKNGYFIPLYDYGKLIFEIGESGEGVFLWRCFLHKSECRQIANGKIGKRKLREIVIDYLAGNCKIVEGRVRYRNANDSLSNGHKMDYGF